MRRDEAWWAPMWLKESKVSETERGSWLCHLHAPRKKRAARVEFAADTATTAKATVAHNVNTGTRKGSSTGTKRSRKGESCSEESSDVSTAKRTKCDPRSASNDLQSGDDSSQPKCIVFTVPISRDAGEFFETDASNPE